MLEANNIRVGYTEAKGNNFCKWLSYSWHIYLSTYIQMLGMLLGAIFYSLVIELLCKHCITTSILIGGSSASSILVAVKFACFRGKTALVSHGKISFCCNSIFLFLYSGTIQFLCQLLRNNMSIVLYNLW